jgi:hypothetical protein
LIPLSLNGRLFSSVKYTNSSSLSNGACPLPFRIPVEPPLFGAEMLEDRYGCGWGSLPEIPKLREGNCRDRRARRGGRQMQITPTLISIRDQKPDFTSSTGNC